MMKKALTAFVVTATVLVGCGSDTQLQGGVDFPPKTESTTPPTLLPGDDYTYEQFVAQAVIEVEAEFWNDKDEICEAWEVLGESMFRSSILSGMEGFGGFNDTELQLMVEMMMDMIHENC